MYHNQRPLVDKLHQMKLQGRDVDWEKIIYCGIPWLPLSVKPPRIDPAVMQHDIQRWFYADEVDNESLQNAGFMKHNAITESTQHRLESTTQKLWAGKMVFGPEPWIKETYSGTLYVEYTMTRRWRHRLPMAWDIDPDHPIRQFVNTLVSDDDLISVSIFHLPPTEYLDPHQDYHQGMKIGLASIFWGAQWDEGNDFGVAGFGMAPIKQDWVGLIDTFNHPHWVVNHSQRDRVSVVINLEHRAIEKLICDSWRDLWR